MNERRDSTEVGGRRFAWRTLGSGPPLVALNGYAATAADWDPGFLAALAESFELVCPDNRGVGGSELGDPAEVNIDAMVQDLERLLDVLEIDRIAVLGWSMGGYLAQGLVERSPARVAAMALLSTDPGGPDAVRAAPAVWARLTDRSGTPREQASRLISVLFPPAVASEIDRRFGEVVAAARAALSAPALDAQEAAMGRWFATSPPPLAPETPPVLALCGSEDVVIPPENAHLLAVRWPDCRVERIEGGGHAFMAQEPERVAELVSSFAARRS